MSRGAALTTALLACFAAPETWVLGLAGFLLRGGIVLLALPVLVLPTPVGIGNVIAPTLTSVAFGEVSTGLIAGTVVIVAGVVGWFCIGGWVAASLEAEAARIVARDEDVLAITRVVRVREPWTGDGGRLDTALGRGQEAGQILLARLVASVPLGVALVWGSIRLVLVTYRELTNPLDAATPVAIRVVRDVPEVIVVVSLAWIVAEVIGALAARRIVLAGDGVLTAIREAVVEVVRRPLPTVARWGIPFGVLLAVLIPSLLAASATWGAVRAAIGGPNATVLFIDIVAFVGLWLIGLLLVGVVCAWRAAVWTVAVAAAPDAARRSGDLAASEGSTRRHPGAVPPV